MIGKRQKLTLKDEKIFYPLHCIYSTKAQFDVRSQFSAVITEVKSRDITVQQSRAVVEGARATLREARPLSALVDQSTQTVAVAAEGETRNRVTFAQEKNGIAATSAPAAEGGSKCAVQ